MALLGFGKKKKVQQLENNGEFVNVLPVQDANNKNLGVITEEQVSKFYDVFTRYKNDKTNLNERLKENEKWFRQRNWDVLKSKNTKDKKDTVEHNSAYLLNGVLNKKADFLDNFPSANILPREESDVDEAKILSSVIPVILEQNNFEKIYDINSEEKCKQGTSCYGVFWDKTKHNGLGDISISDVDVMNLFWESGVQDIQKSPYVFFIRLENNDTLEQTYPQLKGALTSTPEMKVDYEFDDHVDTSDKSLVIECYYKKIINNRVTVQLCTFCNKTVLYATENDPKRASIGLYAHGLYPFVLDTLYRIKGSPAGFGFIDIGKNTQEYIDRTDQAILKNLLANAKPRYFFSKSANVNKEEFADLDNDFVEVAGNVDATNIMPIESRGLPGIYLSVHDRKIEELKEVIGNRDVSTGGSSGATAASAIAAQQEAGSKLSRSAIKGTYNSYKNIVLMIIELIREFYTVPRCFRIMGENGAYEYLSYSNEKLRTQTVGSLFGGKSTMRHPMFDVEVTAQKQNPYNKLSQNELALQFYGAGFFNPQMSDQALACLNMMDFDRKSFVEEKIQSNGTMYQKLLQTQQMFLQLAQMYDGLTGRTNFAQQAAAMISGETMQPTIGAPPANASKESALGGDIKSTEPKVTKNARKRVAESTSPT